MTADQFPQDGGDLRHVLRPLDIVDQADARLRDAYGAFFKANCARYLLHLFLDYPEGEYEVVIDNGPLDDETDAEPRLGRLVVDRSGEIEASAFITFDYMEGATCIVALRPGAVVTVDYAQSETLPSLADSQHIIAPQQWSDPTLLAEAIEIAELTCERANCAGQQATPIRTFPDTELPATFF